MFSIVRLAIFIIVICTIGCRARHIECPENTGDNIQRTDESKNDSSTNKDYPNSTPRIILNKPIIKAFLLFEDGGESVNVIDNEDFYFFNVIIGESSYKGKNIPASNSLRINILFSAINHENVDVFYSVLVKEENDVEGMDKYIIKKIIENKITSFDKNIFIVEFIMKDIGCMPLIISAKISSPYNSLATEKRIEFLCGE